MPAIRAILWDADGVLQTTPAGTWDLAAPLVSQISDALTGAAVNEERIRALAHTAGLDDRIDDVLSVWRTFDIAEPTLNIVEKARTNGFRCYLATNQDAYRAACMRERTPYNHTFDGAYYSCEMGVAKPAKQFFECIVSDLGLTPEELLFIDDQAANVAGARAAGLNAEVWAHVDGIDRVTELLAAHGGSHQLRSDMFPRILKHNIKELPQSKLIYDRPSRRHNCRRAAFAKFLAPHFSRLSRMSPTARAGFRVALA